MMKSFTCFLLLLITTLSICDEFDYDNEVLLSNDVFYSGPKYVVMGTNFTITCRLPHTLQLKWTKEGQRVNLDEDNYVPTKAMKNVTYQVSRLTVVNANAGHSGHYKCYSFSELSHRISVIFDEIKTNEEKKGLGYVLELGKPIQIQCNVSEDSHVNITWFKNGVPLSTTGGRHSILKDNNTLEIAATVDGDAGLYMCAIEGDLSRNRSMEVKTRARVEKFPKSSNLVQDDPLRLHCRVVGYPVPTITWLKDGISLRDSNSTKHIKLLTDDRKVPDAILLIEHLQEDDRAVYTCLVENVVNKVNTTIMVRVKDKLAALWPFLGILAEVAVLCTIIFIYEKRRAKQEYEESDTDQNNESKPVGEQKEKDVRQRK